MNTKDAIMLAGLAALLIPVFAQRPAHPTPIATSHPVIIKPQRMPHKDDQAIAYMQGEGDFQTGQIVLPPNQCVISLDRNLSVTGRVTIHMGKCQR